MDDVHRGEMQELHGKASLPNRKLCREELHNTWTVVTVRGDHTKRSNNISINSLPETEQDPISSTKAIHVLLQRCGNGRSVAKLAQLAACEETCNACFMLVGCN